MNVRKTVKIALLGNPNSGKSSLFNQLTGLRQKVSNFPGVTVDKKQGVASLGTGYEVLIIDFPGTYSLFPTSEDERIVTATFSNEKDENYPDLVVYVADVTNLERQLLLLTQVRDLDVPVVLVLNMKDIAEKEGIVYNVDLLSEQLKVPVVAVSSRTGENLDLLKETLRSQLENLADFRPAEHFYNFSVQEVNAANSIAKEFNLSNPYRAKLIGHHHDWLPFLKGKDGDKIHGICEEAGFVDLRLQIRETMQRYDKFVPIVQKVLKKSTLKNASYSDKIDSVVVHRFWGPVIFFLIMTLIFQAIYSWSGYPMEWIEAIFTGTGEWLREIMPASWFTDLLTDGIIAGLGGIVVFVPQIAILFFLVSLLEEIGYMSRAVFLFDRSMQRFGLNGRSVVALISGGACAIPAIMSTRTISNKKERLITILVTPLISCSARIPVYTILIGFAIPSVIVWRVFNLQGLAFMGLYVLGIAAALIAAFVFKKILKTEERSYLMIEMPEYRMPVLKNVFITVWEKVKSFVIEAGKVIMVISVILWFLASYGPADSMQEAENAAIEDAQELNLPEKEQDDLVASRKIEASYAGVLGKSIEPAIAPLGYDWKIGIALITSFAAREVFVGTMATIYSIGSEDSEMKIRDKMAAEVRPDTGRPVYNIATSLSLLIFYVFAMQCMGTLAVVRKETNTWKWPLIQFLYMSLLAYLGAWLTYSVANSLL